MPKRSSDNYIKVRKTITNKDIINIVGVLSTEWLIKPTQVIDRFIEQSARAEISKRKKV